MEEKSRKLAEVLRDSKYPLANILMLDICYAFRASNRGSLTIDKYRHLTLEEETNGQVFVKFAGVRILETSKSHPNLKP